LGRKVNFKKVGGKCGVRPSGQSCAGAAPETCPPCMENGPKLTKKSLFAGSVDKLSAKVYSIRVRRTRAPRRGADAGVGSGA